MSPNVAKLIEAFVPIVIGAVIFLLVIGLSSRRVTRRYEAQVGRMREALELQRSAIADQKRSIELLEEIRNLLRDKS